jgi:hypothetical protein
MNNGGGLLGIHRLSTLGLHRHSVHQIIHNEFIPDIHIITELFFLLASTYHSKSFSYFGDTLYMYYVGVYPRHTRETTFRHL